MTLIKKSIKKALETITIAGYKVMRRRPGIFVLADKSRLQDVWFSYNSQLISILKIYGVNLVLDVGANRGQFVDNLRNIYQGKIISFEPVSEIFNDLEKTASSDPLWDIYNLALGSQDSTRKINISEKTDFSSFLKTNEYCQQRFGTQSIGSKEEFVSVRRLDILLEELVPDLDNMRIYLKMDTQGYDLEVFKGLGDKCKNVVALQSEVSVIPIYEEMPHWTESIAFFERAGFGIVGLFPVQREGLRIIEYDCMMVNLRLQNQSGNTT